MSQEEDLQRQKALRGGNRSVVTKLVKEVGAITQNSNSSTADDNARLNSIEKSLEDKLKLLKLIDEKIISSCPMAELEKEIEETADWEVKINESLAKIKEFYKGAYNSPPHFYKRSQCSDSSSRCCC